MAFTAHDLEYIGQLSFAKRLSQSYTDRYRQVTTSRKLGDRFLKVIRRHNDTTRSEGRR